MLNDRIRDNVLHSNILTWLRHLDAFTVVVPEMSIFDGGAVTRPERFEKIEHLHGCDPLLHIYSSGCSGAQAPFFRLIAANPFVRPYCAGTDCKMHAA